MMKIFVAPIGPHYPVGVQVPPEQVVREALAIGRARPELCKAPILKKMRWMSPDEHIPFDTVERLMIFGEPGRFIYLTNLTFALSMKKGKITTDEKNINVNLNRISLLNESFASDLLRSYTRGLIHRPVVVKFWVAELGKRFRDDQQGFILYPCLPRTDGDGTRGFQSRYAKHTERFLRRFENKMVSACKECDSMVNSTSTQPRTCPFCDKPLEVYWRGAKMYKVSLAPPKPPQERHYHTRDWVEVLDDRIKKSVNLSRMELGNMIDYFYTELLKPCMTSEVGPMTARVHIPRMYHSLMLNTIELQSPDEPVNMIQEVIELEPTFPIKDEYLRYQGPIQDRLAAGAAEVAPIDLARAKELQAIQAEQDRIKTLGNDVLDFWRKQGFTIEGEPTLGRTSTKLFGVFDGVYFRIPAPNDKVNMILLNDNGKEIERFHLDPTEERKFLKFIQHRVNELKANVTLPVFEKASRTKQKGSQQQLILSLGPERDPRLKKPVLACEKCGAMYIKQARHHRVIDQFKTTSCPYCGVPTNIVERKPRYLHALIQPPPDKPVRTGYRPPHQAKVDRKSFWVQYHGQLIEVPVPAAKWFPTVFYIQDGFENGAIGPMQLALRYVLKELNHPSFTESTIKRIEPGKLSRPLEWRPPYALPEDTFGK